jgi:hypothetical protein
MATMRSTFGLLSRHAAPLALSLFGFASLPAAAQDGFLDKINKRPSEIRGDRRADKILLPVLSKLQTPPAEVLADLEAGPAWMLIDASVQGRWEKMEAWAKGEPQQAALKALADATKQFDRGDPGMGWGLPYGATSEAAEAVRLDLHIDLGAEEPTIAEADPRYLPRVAWLEMLAHVEATRLLASGDTAGAIGTLVNVFFLGRELSDRELAVEVRRGFEIMIRALSRVRDVAYEDFRAERKLGIAELRTLIRRLDDSALRIDRIRFPEGDRLGVEQLIARSFGAGGKPDAAKLGPMLARIATREQPLRIFNESARWGEASKSMGDRKSMEDALARVYGDWTTRWPIDPFDARMRETFQHVLLNKAKYPLVGMLADLTVFYDLRQILHTEAVGTRASLGLLGYYYENLAFARTITSARPQWIGEKEPDPFNPEERNRGGVPPLRYTRPVTDDAQKRPHAMTVVTGSGYNFRLNLDDSVWLVWSVGSNNINDFARFVQNTVQRVTAADYVIWPPIESLTRQHLKDLDALK